MSFDLSLARGLDYYTGIIYEVVLIGEGQVCPILVFSAKQQLTLLLFNAGTGLCCWWGPIRWSRRDVFKVRDPSALRWLLYWDRAPLWNFGKNCEGEAEHAAVPDGSDGGVDGTGPHRSQTRFGKRTLVRSLFLSSSYVFGISSDFSFFSSLVPP